MPVCMVSQSRCPTILMLSITAKSALGLQLNLSKWSSTLVHQIFGCHPKNVPSVILLVVRLYFLLLFNIKGFPRDFSDFQKIFCTRTKHMDTHTCTHTHTHIHTTHAHIHVHTCMHMHSHSHVHTHSQLGQN